MKMENSLTKSMRKSAQSLAAVIMLLFLGMLWYVPTIVAQVGVVHATISFDLSTAKTASYDRETNQLTVSDETTRAVFSINPKPKEGEPLIVADSRGKVYTIENNTKPVPMGTPENPTGLIPYKGKTAIITFSNAPDQKTAFTTFDPVYDQGLNRLFETIIMDDGTHYRVPAKLMVVDGGPQQVIARVESKGTFDPEKVVFKTFTGMIIPAELSPDRQSYTLTVEPGNIYAPTHLMAIYTGNPDGSELVGKLKIYSYEKKTKQVSLVPVGGASIPETTALELKNYYAQYGIELEVSVMQPYTGPNSQITLEGTSHIDSYNKSMNDFNKQFSQWASKNSTFDKKAKYLFFFDYLPAGGDLAGELAGDMPRAKQFGYIFMPAGGNLALSAAHALGHGMFCLYHTFDPRYGITKGTTRNLMDYPSSSGQIGYELTKLQWDILHSPGLACR